tara:strand:+ start:300 stop:506 length:207 start_codon:yes stop_codon:yes gene_type:complete
MALNLRSSLSLKLIVYEDFDQRLDRIAGDFHPRMHLNGGLQGREHLSLMHYSRELQFGFIAQLQGGGF